MRVLKPRLILSGAVMSLPRDGQMFYLEHYRHVVGT